MLTSSILFRTTFIIAIMLSIVLPCRADDVLRFRVAGPSLPSRIYSYRTISRAQHVVQPGDVIEYDVYINTNSAGVGGIDICNTDGTCWRKMPGWQDQHGCPGHPNADISDHAQYRWYSRALPAPADAIGKTINMWNLAVDGFYGPNTVLSAIYDNIRITNDGQVVLQVYSSGAPECDEEDFASPSTTSLLLAGPAHRTGTQTGTYFFYWYDAPYNNADPNQMPWHPYGLVGNSWVGYNNAYYSCRNEYWWEAEFADMNRAGISVAALICWGNRHATYFNNNDIATKMVPALDRSGCNVKIAMFDDTTSEACEWNVDQGRSYYPHQPMPLSDQNNWTYFYDRKIKLFFEAIPQKYWATHNGLPLEQGGRPIIITYSASWFSGVGTYGAPMWQWIKDRFAADFKDSNGNAIVPWVIHEKSWFSSGGAATADGEYAWGAATNNGSTFTVGDYTTSAIGPGYDDRRIRNPGLYADRFDGGRLIGSFNGRNPHNSDLLMVETWNELWEGTPLQRCKDYKYSTGAAMSETFYIDTMRSLVTGSLGLRDYDATFLRTWQIPANAKKGSIISVTVRNDGLLPWDAGSVSLGGRLLYLNTTNVVPGTDRVLAPLPRTVLSGEECQISFAVPDDWPNSSAWIYTLQLDMMRGSEWFASFGDSPVTKVINIKPSDSGAPGRPNSFTATPGEKRVVLNWRNPTNSDFRSTVIRMSTSGYLSSPSQGIPVTNRYASPGSQDSFTLYPVQAGQTIYFSAFAQDSSGNWSSAANISTTPLADTTAPAPVTGFFTVLQEMRSYRLTWLNPTDEDLAGVVIRYKTTGYPSDAADGNLLTVQTPTPGTNGYFIHDELEPGVTYYYAIFTYDADGNYSPGVRRVITAPIINCSGIKQFPDNVEIILSAKIISGIFPGESCIYVQELDGSAGIRVEHNGQGFKVGDIVDISGKIGTRYVSGQAAERKITQPVITAIDSGEVKPVAMVCEAVGGADNPPLVRGVNEGTGVYNIGLLVRVFGRVTYANGTVLIVDDGSSPPNQLGLSDPIPGVFVQCAAMPEVKVGDVVAVTGVVQGSIPVNWTTNRRYIVARSASDISIYAP